MIIFLKIKLSALILGGFFLALQKYTGHFIHCMFLLAKKVVEDALTSLYFSDPSNM